jgi:hypothetical protein
MNPLGLGPSSFKENNEAAFAATRAVNLQISQDLNVLNAYEDYIDHIFATTGKRLRNPSHIWEGEDPLKSRGALEDLKLHAADFHAEANTLAEETGLFAPLSQTQIWLRANANAVSLDIKRAEVASRAGGMGKFGAFLGDTGAFFTDPIIAISSLMNPSRAVGVLGTAAYLALITGGAELLIQPGVQKYRAVLGLEHGFAQGARNVAFAAGAGGAFGLATKLAGLGLRKLLDIHAAVVKTPTQNELIAIATLERAVADDASNRAANPAHVDAAARAADRGEALTEWPVTRREREAAEAGGFGPTAREREAGDAGGFDDTPSPREREAGEAGGFDREPVVLEVHRATLPRELAGAKPRYQQSELDFESDVDRALFIVSEGGWLTDADYRAWLKKTLDIETDFELDGLAHRARLRVAEAVKNSVNGDVVTVKAPREAPPAPERQPQQVRDRAPDEQAAHAAGAAGAAAVLKESGREMPEHLEELLEIVRGNKAAPSPGQSLLAWLKANGGVRDESGELEKLLRGPDGKSIYPGLLNNKTGAALDVTTKKGFKSKPGMNIRDHAGEAAARAGFFPKLLSQLDSPGPAPDTRPDLWEAIVDEVGGNKRYIVDDVTTHALEMDNAARQLDADLFRANIDVDEMSNLQVASALKRHEANMEEEFRVLVEDDPDMEIPVGTVDDANGNRVTKTATARQVQDEIDADQNLIEEMKNCFIPGWTI